MIIDSSAILAVIGKEPGCERIVHQLAASPEPGSAPRPGWRRASCCGAIRAAGKTALARFLQENSIQTVASMRLTPAPRSTPIAVQQGQAPAT